MKFLRMRVGCELCDRGSHFMDGTCYDHKLDSSDPLANIMIVLFRGTISVHRISVLRRQYWFPMYIEGGSGENCVGYQVCVNEFLDVGFMGSVFPNINYIVFLIETIPSYITPCVYFLETQHNCHQQQFFSTDAKVLPNFALFFSEMH